MKLINKLFIAVCIVTTTSAQAQDNGTSKKKVTTHKTARNVDTSANAEAAKNKYKSKQWRQGINTVEETRDTRKTKPGTETKPRKSKTTPPTPYTRPGANRCATCQQVASRNKIIRQKTNCP